MLIKVIIGVIFTTWLLLSDCSSLKQHNPAVFKVNAAYYQSWVVSDNEKGTDIVLTLNGVKEGVIFDSIVFRGVRLKAFVTTNNEDVTIKSILPSGKSRLKLDSEAVNLPNQLIYHYNGERKSYPLNSMDRKTTRFY